MRNAIMLKMLFRKNDIKMLRNAIKKNVIRMHPVKRGVLSFLLKESKELVVLILTYTKERWAHRTIYRRKRCA